MNLRISNHCGVCTFYTSRQGSSMKAQDGFCCYHEYKTHSKLVCDFYKDGNTIFTTKLNNQINKQYGNIKKS